VYECIAELNDAAKTGSWADTGEIFAAIRKLWGVAKIRYAGNTALHDEALTWERLVELAVWRHQTRPVSLRIADS